MEQMKKAFKQKTIEKVIRGHIGKWLKTIEDEKLRNDVELSYIVTGGAITSMLLGDMPNDFDVYLQDVSVAERLAKYYVSKLPENQNDKCSGIKVIAHADRVEVVVPSSGLAGEAADNEKYEYFETLPDNTAGRTIDEFIDSLAQKDTGKFTVLAVTSNAITLTDRVQIVLRFIGSPEEIHKNYDFVHCTNWFTHTQGLNLNQAALISTMTRELRYVGSKFPLCSMFRLRKFIKRGWSINAGEMLKIGYDISKLNLNDITTLNEQLTGVDAHYFMQLIYLIRERHNGDIASLDRSYLVTLIDEVFGE